MDLKEQHPSLGHRHPWELARTKYLLGIVQQYQRDSDLILDIGSGDNFFNQHLSNYQHLYAVDTAYPPTNVLAQGKQTYTPDLTQVPDQMDIILALDVLEHQADDRVFLAQLKAKLKPGGKLLITVPAHPALYSGHDRFLGHYRRYTAQRIPQLAQELGLSIIMAHSFFWSLYLWRRWWHPAKMPQITQTALWQWPRHHLITQMVLSGLRLDLAIGTALRRWIELPGLSLVYVLTI